MKHDKNRCTNFSNFFLNLLISNEAYLKGFQ